MPGRFLYYGEILLRLLPEQDYAIRLEALAEALPLEVAATDAAGRVIVWNAALAAVAGPRDEALARPLLQALPWLAADPNVDWQGALDDVLGGGADRILPRHPLGDRVVRATLGKMQGPAGEILGAVLSLEDITHGMREEERRRLRVRTNAVAGLGAGIAHEIRNPLNAMSLHLQLLRERLEDPRTPREDLLRKTDTMIAEVERMESLVRSLLSISRGGPLVRRPERIDEIVDGVVGRLRETAREGNVTLEVTHGSERSLPLDRTSVEAAVSNIVQNAIEAARPGGHVWIASRDDPHSTVVVVSDDGPGVRPDQREKVFEIFWTSKRGGTGLGLPLARTTVERHGGELEVLDRPGGGSRFVIHLPRVEGLDVTGAAGR